MNEENKHLVVVEDANGNLWGPFDDAAKAHAWAERHAKLAGGSEPEWDIVALRPPD